MKIILVCLIVVVAINTAQAQAYHPFPLSDAIWTQRVGQGDSMPIYQCYGLMNSDTTVNIVSYHKLYRSVDTVFTANEAIGGIREDADRKVYFFDFSKGSERMLYDFSVNVGDTIRNSGITAIVDRIDSIMIGGDYHRRINFRMPGGSTWTLGGWVDGLGNSSLGGLLNFALAQPTCDCASNIICFKENNVWVYHNAQYSSTNCVNNALGVKPAQEAAVSVSLSPNPVTGNSTLRVNGPIARACLSIYSFTGAEAYSYTFAGSSTIQINSSKLSPGLYYYRLSTSQGAVVTGKFLVQ